MRVTLFPSKITERPAMKTTSTERRAADHARRYRRYDWIALPWALRADSGWNSEDSRTLFQPSLGEERMSLVCPFPRRRAVARFRAVCFLAMLACAFWCVTRKDLWCSLSAEEARAALIEMAMGAQYEDLRASAPILRTETIVYLNEDCIEIGAWKCDLRRKTFIASRITEETFAECSGKFFLDWKAQWRATILAETRGHR